MHILSLIFKITLIILFFTTSKLFSLTFSNGQQVEDKIEVIDSNSDTSSKLYFKNYNIPNWGLTQINEIDAKKTWSQSLDENVFRLTGPSHRFEYRALDCHPVDCKRGNFKGSYGRTETYLDQERSNLKGEHGENWYAWSFKIDNSDFTYKAPKEGKGIIKKCTKIPGSERLNCFQYYQFAEQHLISFGQAKQEETKSVLGSKWSHCRKFSTEVVFMLQYYPSAHGLGVNRQNCKEDGVYESYPFENIIIHQNDLFNQWHDIILHAKWGEDGFLKLFVNGELTYLEEGFINNDNLRSPKTNKLIGPTFRFGIYQVNAPKEFNGKVIAWYDEFTKSSDCNNQEFSNVIKELGYNCNELVSQESFAELGMIEVLNPKYEIKEFISK